MLVGQPQAEHLLAQPAQLCMCTADSLHLICILFCARACFCISDHGSACCPVTPHLRRLFIAKATAVSPPIRFFGGAFGGGFGFGGGEEEEQTPKGHDVHVDLEVSLRDLYVGTTVRVRLACLGRWPRTLRVSCTFPVVFQPPRETRLVTNHRLAVCSPSVFISKQAIHMRMLPRW